MVLESFRINHYNPAVKKRRPTAFFLLLGDPNNRTVPKDKRQEGRIRQFICRFGTEWHKYRRSPILGRMDTGTDRKIALMDVHLSIKRLQ